MALFGCPGNGWLESWLELWWLEITVAAENGWWECGGQQRPAACAAVRLAGPAQPAQRIRTG